MDKGIKDYKGCTDCLSYKYSAASLLQPYKQPELEAYSQGTPTYLAMPLKDATNDFLSNYIRSASKYYNTAQISSLRKNMDVTREGLTKIIEKTGTNLDDISNTLNKNTDYFIKNDPACEVKDPIEKYFIQTAGSKGFDLKEDTALFKRTYANNTARTFGFYNAAKELGYEKANKLDTKEVIKYGINDAAETLGITPRRLHDLVKDYYVSIKSPETANKQDESETTLEFLFAKKEESETEKAEKERLRQIEQEQQKKKEKPLTLDEELSKAA
ncbi:MAG: hypothetical protein ACOCQG_05145 [Candidatus Nanoarchaeia archaeon]